MAVNSLVSATLPYGVTVSTADSGSASGGSNPSGATRQGALDNPLSLGQ